MRIILFFLSAYGFASMGVRSLSFNKSLSWIFTFSAQILLFYISGLLGFLYGSMIITYIIGLILGIYQIYNIFYKYKNRFSLKPFFKNIDLAMVFILIWFIIFGYIVIQNTYFNHYDDYSHWALIVKYLFTEQTFPDAGASIIDFNTYPLGTALFINYFINIVGYSVGNILLGQLVLGGSAYYGIMSIVKGKRRTVSLLLLMITFGVFTYFNPTRYDNLLVDSLLPLMALVIISGLWIYRDHLKNLSLNTLVISGALIIFKSSAIYFVIVPLILYCVTVILFFKRETKKKKIKYIFITGISSFIPFILWQIYISRTFTSDDTGKHTMSLSNYREQFLDKDPQTINDIFDAFVDHVFNFQTVSSQGVLLTISLFIITGIIFKYILKKKQYFFILGLYTIGVTALYYFGILLMYLFSMPTYEAVNLAGFSRYALSTVILGLGIYIITLVISLQQMFKEEKYIRLRKHPINIIVIITLSLFSLSLYYRELQVLADDSQGDQSSVPVLYQNIATENFDLTNDRYLAVINNDEERTSGYTRYAGEYHLYSSYVDEQSEFSNNLESFSEFIQRYDYIVMLEINEQFINQINELYGFNIEEPRIYSVKEVSSN